MPKTEQPTMPTRETLPDGTRAWRVETPDFRRGVQVVYDHWRHRDRVLRYLGNCPLCGTRCYAFDDGENDPRGMLGDHAADPLVASEHDQVGPDVMACFLCANGYESYQWLMRIASRRWSTPDDRED